MRQLDLIEKNIFFKNTSAIKKEDLEKFLNEIENVENHFKDFGEIGPRNEAILNVKKLLVYRSFEDKNKIIELIQETFNLLLRCYFDKLIDRFFVSILISVQLPIQEFKRLLEYLNKSTKNISNALSQILIIQFNLNNTLFTDGKVFFEQKKNLKFCEFINNLEERNDDIILKDLKTEISFAISLANSLKTQPELREKIIVSLPNDAPIQKEKLLLLLSYDLDDFDKAFEILKGIDLSSLNYFECEPILNIVHKKQAWDFEIVIIKKLLEKEQDQQLIHDLELRLFNANLELNNHLDVIRIGEKILSKDLNQNLLSDNNKELIISRVCNSYLKRGNSSKAKDVINKLIIALTQRK